MSVEVPLPKSSSRLRRWFLLSAITLSVSIVVFGCLAVIPQYRLAEEVKTKGGIVAWHRFMVGIQSIQFSRGGVNDAWVQQARWRNLPTLQRLALKRCGLSDVCLPSLTVLKNLEELDLEGNFQITAEGLSELKSMPNLKRLSVSEMILASKTEIVTPLSKLTQLKELNIYGVEVTDEQLAPLRLALPNTKIEVIIPIATGMAMRPIPKRALVRVAIDPRGQWLAVGDAEGGLRVWDLARKEIAWTERAHAEWLFGLAFDPTGRILATAGGDESIRLWDVEQRQLLATLRGHDDDVHAIAFAPDGRSLYSSGDDVTVRRWAIGDLETLRRSASREIDGASVTWEGHDDTIPALAISRDGRWLVSGSRDGTAQLRDLRTGGTSQRLVHSIHQRPLDERGLSVAAFDPSHPRGDVMGVSFDQQSQHLATTGYDGQVRIWDVATGQLQTEWPAHDGWAYGIEHTPSGEQLATFGRQGQIVQWNERGERQREFQADDDVASVAFSPDGSQLVACTANGQLKLWSLADRSDPGRELMKPEGVAVFE